MTSSGKEQVIPGAGGVVLRGAAGVTEVLLVRYHSGAWVFPKGHLEAGERNEQAALREVAEETGVQASIVSPLPTTRYTNDKGEVREVFWFLMRPERAGGPLEDTFSAGGFVAADQAAQQLSYPEDRELLAQALSAWQG